MRYALAISLIFATTSAAHALPPYLKRFQDLYAGPTAPAEYPALVAKERCSVCHLPEKSKSNRNSYGDALRKAGLVKPLAKAASDGDDRAAKAIDAAFEKAGQQKSPEGSTYGELFKAGKLPGK